MKLKRMTLVAAAAMVGPTLLAATPAMAADQPAATVPDAAPKEAAAPAAAPGPETKPEAKPAPETAPVTPVAPAVAQPAAQAAAPAPAPVAPAPAPAPAAEKVAEVKNAPADSILMGPDVTVSGIPDGGFKADGSWTPLTVKVDNSANIEVTNYTPRITLSQDEGKLKADQVKVEYLATDAAGNKSWKPASFIGGYNDHYFAFGLGTKPSVARESVSTIDVRISFAADTAVVPFQLSSEGLSIRSDGGNAWSGSTWYETSIAGAKANPTNPVLLDGPSLSLNGVPAGGFKAGGDWQELTLHVDNTGKQSLERFSLAFVVARPDFDKLAPKHIEAEVYGPNGWQRVHHVYSDAGVVYFLIGDTHPIAAGQVTDVKLRVRFTKDAPLGDIVLRPAGGAEDDFGSGENHVYVQSPSQGRLSTIVAADTNTGDTNQPKPNGGAQPISQTGTGTGTGTQTGGQTGGQLAETGSSPATTWAIGGAGVALTLGAALVAGTGRHRRRTTA
ncbi:hypothetical protein ACFXDJ_30550 [Streptomyces sp. NPDC059443]|uniref:hypothetical protein n=1 Tax=unclassified Streptomyces TaxID=2593676 RepID=UPI0036CB6624